MSQHSSQPRFADLTGERFGRWTVLGPSMWKARKTLWRCRCNCGSTKWVCGRSLRSGLSLSCGCIRREMVSARNRRHGLTRTKEYRAWQSMITRCYNPNFIWYEKYGGRGIKVCERWRQSFEAFLEDMGKAPSPRHSIDRINGDQGYSPKNCRWASTKEQARNQKTNHLLTHNGETFCVSEWAERLGISMWTLHNRITRLGWSVHDALTIPVRIGQKHIKHATLTVVPSGPAALASSKS